MGKQATVASGVSDVVSVAVVVFVAFVVDCCCSSGDRRPYDVTENQRVCAEAVEVKQCKTCLSQFIRSPFLCLRTLNHALWCAQSL